jgi:acetyltransferase-like isoleucine patch superfamily enzyme
MKIFRQKIFDFFCSSRVDKINQISIFFYRIKTNLLYKSSFKAMGENCIIRNPLMIGNPQFITLGENVFIRDGIRLEVILARKGKIPNVNIEQNVHIVCQNKIIIGNNVSITPNCSIVDVTHPYEDIYDDKKIGSRVLDDDSFVEIGDGTFIGIGTVILPGVKIGKYVIIGANSVISRDIPDYSVAAGIPAKVIKHFDRKVEEWIKVF